MVIMMMRIIIEYIKMHPDEEIVKRYIATMQCIKDNEIGGINAT